MSIVRIEDLNIYYDNKKIIKNLNMDIEENKITSIIGPSGCGKTTFLKSLNRMLEDNSSLEGQISYKGKDIYKKELEKVRRDIGMVFQKPTPFPFSIYKNLSYVLKYYGMKSKRDLDKKIVDLLDYVGLYDEVREDLQMDASKLSGGQQQRLCIARALSSDPKVLLLDEPCSALDIKSTDHIEKMLKKISEDFTIIIVTHNLAQARRLSDYTGFFLNGELVEYNSTETIFREPSEKKTKEYIEGIYG